MTSSRSTLTRRRIAEFCELRLAPVLEPTEVESLRQCLVGLLERKEYPPYRGSGLDIKALAELSTVDARRLAVVRSHIRPIFDAVTRAVAESRLRLEPKRKLRQAVMQSGSAKRSLKLERPMASATTPERKRPGRRPREVVEFPELLEATWEEPGSFGAALRLHAARHGESIYHLYNAMVRPEDGVDRSTLFNWGRGKKAPRSSISLEILKRIERRYRLPEGYFAGKMGGTDRAPGDFDLGDVPPAERRRLAWHLPEDFNRRPRN